MLMLVSAAWLVGSLNPSHEFHGSEKAERIRLRIASGSSRENQCRGPLGRRQTTGTVQRRRRFFR
jgi:hypothetical protein